jgi:hypothetical protein
MVIGLAETKRDPGFILISQRRKVRKGFFGLKMIAFDFLCVTGVFARVKNFQSVVASRDEAKGDAGFILISPGRKVRKGFWV